MQFRARHLKQKEINVALNTKLHKPRVYITENQIKSFLINPVHLLQTYQIFATEGGENKTVVDSCEKLIKFDTDYLQLKILNLNENFNSQTRFTQDFLTRMVYNHGIAINFIDTTDIVEEEEEEEEQEEQELSVSGFTKTRLLTCEEYFNSDIIKSWKENQKYKLFYEKYFIRGITDSFIYDKNIYELINNEIFYDRFSKPEIIKNYETLKIVLDKKIKEFQDELKSQIEINKTKQNELTDYERTIGKQTVIINLIATLGLNLNELPKKITNAEFNTLAKKFIFKVFNTN
jgi:hypothetical protein